VRPDYGYGKVSSSLIMGSTPASSSCSSSRICRAMVGSDTAGLRCNSVYGTAWRRVGIMSSQYTNLGKTCGVSGGLTVCRPVTTPERLCSMPWEKRYGLPLDIDSADLVRSWFSLVSRPVSVALLYMRVTLALSLCFMLQFVRDSVFAFFNSTDCGQISAAVAINPSQVDFFPPMTFSGIDYAEVQEEAKFFLGRSAATASECREACDSYDFAVITDEDGSVTGTAGRFVPGAHAAFVWHVLCSRFTFTSFASFVHMLVRSAPSWVTIRR
jgi:hypothetical protein